MNNFPFKEKILEETEKHTVLERFFLKDLNEEELIWHRDKEDREIFILEGEGWYIQFENELPHLMHVNSFFKINRNIYHRLISKNISNLKIKLVKHKQRKYHEN
jgi:quercetin dioxygenase-like cupin family protein